MLSHILFPYSDEKGVPPSMALLRRLIGDAGSWQPLTNQAFVRRPILDVDGALYSPPFNAHAPCYAQLRSFCFFLLFPLPISIILDDLQLTLSAS